MKLYISLFLTLFCFFKSIGDDLSIMGANLQLNGGWMLWASTKDPNDAYLASLSTGHTNSAGNVVGTVNFGTTLNSGLYYIALRCGDYSANGTGLVDVDWGGATITVTNFTSSGFNGLWTTPMAITTLSNSTSLQLTARRTQATNIVQLYLMEGLFITTNSVELVDANNRVISFNYNTNLSTLPEIKGNLIDNSSFEVGMGRGWGLGEGQDRNYTVKSLLSTNVLLASHGTNSVSIPNGQQLVSKALRLRGNRTYTFSAWCYNEHFPGTVKLTMENVTTAPSGYTATSTYNSTIAVGASNWTRISIGGSLLAYPTADFRLRMLVSNSQDGHTFIDAIQLEEGSLTTYAPRQDLELGLSTTNTANIFISTETPAYRVTLRNNGIVSYPVLVRSEVYGLFNDLLFTNLISATIPAGTTTNVDVSLTSGSYGTHRVFSWIHNVDHSRDEMLMTLQRPLVGTNTAFASSFGSHSPSYSFLMQNMKRLGVNWNRTTSSGSYFRWNLAEPTDGNFVYYDTEIAAATAAGIDILGTMGVDTNSLPSAYFDSSGYPAILPWTNFVQTIVNHYKPYVKYWEIWNEPNALFPTNIYGELLRNAAMSIRVEDSTAKVVAFGGSPDFAWSLGVVNYLGVASTNMDYADVHQYPSAIFSTINAFQYLFKRTNNLDVFNTEAGVWNQGFYVGENSDYIQYDDYTRPYLDSDRFQYGGRGASEYMIKNCLTSLGVGYTKYFYYDSRITIGPGFTATHPTWNDYDDSIRPLGAAYGVLASLFDYSRGVGVLITNASTFGFLFDREGTGMGVIWNTNNGSHKLTITLTTNELSLFDIMGNPITYSGGVIPYGQSPVYLIGNGISTNTLKSALAAGVSAILPDIDPPKLLMITWPTGITIENPVRFRWLAIDRFSLPYSGLADGIQYAYKLEGYDSAYSDWSARPTATYSDLTYRVYTLYVKARDAAGNESAPSSVPLYYGVSGTPISLRIIR